jgi:hypothetical protein
VIIIPEDRDILEKIAATGGVLSKEYLEEIPIDLLEKAAAGTQEYLESLQTAMDLKKGNGCHDPSCGKFCASDSEHNFKLLPSEGTNVAILKTIEDQQIIFGIALQPAPFVDLQGDVIAKEEIESAAHDFLVKSRAVGYRHKEMLEKRADVIESYVAPTDINWNGNVIKEGSWVVGVKIHDPVIWQKVKDKELNAFSIGGKGKRTAVNSL